MMTAPEVDLLPPPDEEELLAPPEEELAPAADASPAGSTALVEILPAGFPLPALIKFVPDARIRVAADADAERLLAIEVIDESTMRVMDACLERQRLHKKTIEAEFKDPTDLANQLHKRLTGLRGEWLERTDQAIKAGGDRIVAMQRRLEREANEERRKKQEEADRQAREQAERDAAAARQAHAPAEVVEQLEEEAKTATAPPVGLFGTSRTTLKSTSVVTTWKPRLKGTESSAAEQQPSMSELTPAQRLSVLSAMKAVVEGRAPIAIFEIGWPYLNQRARADKKAFALEGFEVYEDGGTRGKGGRRV